MFFDHSLSLAIHSNYIYNYLTKELCLAVVIYEFSIDFWRVSNL